MGWWAEAFTRDGSATKFLEKLPGIGHVAAGVQYLSGNREHAKRALATSTNSLISTAGAVGGFVVGGPVGAIAGGTLGSAIGLSTEYGIATAIEDKQVKGDVGEVTVGRVAVDVGLGALGGLVGGGSVASVGKAGLNASKEIGKHVGKEIIQKGASTMVKYGGGGMMKSGIAAMMGQGLKDGLSGYVGGPSGDPTTDSPPDDDDTEQKKLERIVTMNQERAAREVWDSCSAIQMEFAGVVCDVNDLFGNMKAYLPPAFRYHGPWHIADACWTQQRGDYANKTKPCTCGVQPCIEVYSIEKVFGQMTPAQRASMTGHLAPQSLLQQKIQILENALLEVEYGVAVDVAWDYQYP